MRSSAKLQFLKRWNTLSDTEFPEEWHLEIFNEGMSQSMEKILIKDAYENNLKHLDLEIPLNAFTCVTGCSGCGKSSLVFDTIYAESQRGFLEGMTGNIYGQKLMNKPKVGSIENLRPALNISQNYYNVNPRSTIGTTTEISYYLRSLFAMLSYGERFPQYRSGLRAEIPPNHLPCILNIWRRCLAMFVAALNCGRTF